MQFNWTNLLEPCEAALSHLHSWVGFLSSNPTLTEWKTSVFTPNFENTQFSLTAYSQVSNALAKG